MNFDHWLILVLSGWCISASIMTALWLLYLWRKDPSVVDIGWAGSIGAVAIWMHSQTGGEPGRPTLILFCVVFWATRLSTLLLRRMIRGQKDRRYTELSERWKQGLYWKYFFFFQAQAASVALLTVPIALVMLAPQAEFTIWDWVGFPLFLLAITGETVADQQMARFRAAPTNQSRVCNVGLWKYSRHPNYFFEWIIWVSYAVISLNHPEWPFGLISPLLIFVSIYKVTGIPPTEERLLASKGDAYRIYQESTSVFFPWPPKVSKTKKPHDS